MADADLPGQGNALVQLAPRQALAHARDRHGPIAQGKLRRLGHDRAVQSAGEGHCATAVTLQQSEQTVAFGNEIEWERRHGGARQVKGSGSGKIRRPKTQKKVLRRNAVGMGF